MSTDPMVFLKQLLDNAEYVNETGVLNVVALFKHSDVSIVDGTSYAPGALLTFQRLIELRSDLCTPAVLQALRELAADPNERIRAVVRVTLEQFDLPPRSATAFAGVLHIEAESVADAKRQLRLRVPYDLQILELKVEADGAPQTATGTADTTEAALAKAREQVPQGATVVGHRELAAPSRRLLDIDAEDKRFARRFAKRGLASNETVQHVSQVVPGRKGFLGIGRRLPRYQAELFRPAIMEITYKENARISARIGRGNRGTRQDSFDMAVAYWRARMSSERKDPFVLYVFDDGEAARRALMELPCIHEEESGQLVCSEVLTFGYYAQREDGRETGTYEAIICGDDLTRELWDQAKVVFTKHGGVRKNDKEPEANAGADPHQPALVPPRPESVAFVEEQRSEGVTYCVHRSPDVPSALAFLDENPVNRPQYHVVVETPNGTYCRDVNGFYKE